MALQLSGSLVIDGDFTITGSGTFTGDGSGLTGIPGVTPPFEEIEHQALYLLVQSASLFPGKHYLISDYQTCYDQPNWTANRSAITVGNYKSGSVEPLVVLATSSSSLAPYAYSTIYPKDIIKYNIGVTQTEVTNGLAKGRIYERIDEVGNRTDYDWRSIRFKRYDGFLCDLTFTGKLSISSGETTGSVFGVDTNFSNDFSVGDVLGVYNTNNSQIGGFDFYEIVNVSGSSYMDITGSYYNAVNNTYYSRARSYSGISPFQTNTVSVYKNEYEYSTFDVEGTPAGNNWYNNHLGDNLDWDVFILSNNVFRGGDYRDNYFDSNVVGNTLDDDCYGNHCGRNFQYNSITDDFDDNKIGNDFGYNFIDSDFQENIIGNDFQSNMLGDDDGTDFNNNTINGSSFTNNWTTGYDAFINNVINSNFSNNVLYRRFENNLVTGTIFNNLFNGDIADNQFKDSFNNNRINNNFSKNILNYFGDNTILNTFERNQFGGECINNIFSGSFFDNTAGNGLNVNTFRGIAAYNQIGTGFYSNTLGSEFGVGYGNPRGNKIGNSFTGNIVGEYFYSNTISDNFINNNIGEYFQQNTVLADNVNGNDFNSYYGNVNTIDPIVNPNVSGSDGLYVNVATTTNGQGTGATMDVTITSGTASVAVNQIGRLYKDVDQLYITGSLIGGGNNLELDIDTVSPTPVVYTNIDSTIVRNYDQDLKLTYIGSSFGIVGILEPVD